MSAVPTFALRGLAPGTGGGRSRRSLQTPPLSASHVDVLRGSPTTALMDGPADRSPKRARTADDDGEGAHQRGTPPPSAGAAVGAGSGAAEVARPHERFAVTFGEVCILHAGGEEVGSGRRERGFSTQELRALHRAQPANASELVELAAALPSPLCDDPALDACVLVLRGGAALIHGDADAAERLLAEQRRVTYDKKYFDARTKRTKNKRARFNTVFADLPVRREHNADFSQPTVHAFRALPELDRFRNGLERVLGLSAVGLNAEGNHYYEQKSGIGFHGDRERKVVICLSLGATSVLRYVWRAPRSSAQFAGPIDVTVRHGDVYVMSEKATGFDWLERSKPRLVHAAGAAPYITHKQ